jgi:CspA family cold shock protein
MPTGTVKWFDRRKGYGFIQPEVGSKDVCVHASSVELAGMDSLHEGQKLRYDLQRDAQTGRLWAGHLRSA